MADSVSSSSSSSSSSRGVMWGLVALAVALLCAGVFIAGALGKIRRTDDQIAVTGSAKRPIRADYAVWRPSVSTQNVSIADAMRELEGYSVQVTEFLRSQKVADSAFTLRPVETYAIQSYTNTGEMSNRPPVYRVTQTFEVRLHDVDAMTRLARDVNALATKGIPITGSAPEYIYTGLADMRIEMLGDATKDARTRAEQIAKSVGVKLGSVRNVQLGVFQITPRNSTEVSGMGMNDVSSVDKDITAVVRVTFALD